jgi:hypothetical protein
MQMMSQLQPAPTGPLGCLWDELEARGRTAPKIHSVNSIKTVHKGIERLPFPVTLNGGGFCNSVCLRVCSLVVKVNRGKLAAVQLQQTLLYGPSTRYTNVRTDIQERYKKKIRLLQ